jgi:hypothetical protein
MAGIRSMFKLSLFAWSPVREAIELDLVFEQVLRCQSCRIREEHVTANLCCRYLKTRIRIYETGCSVT